MVLITSRQALKDAIIYADLAGDAYFDGSLDAVGWKQLSHKDLSIISKSGSFTARQASANVYVKGKEVVVSIRGTDGGFDYLDDVLLAKDVKNVSIHTNLFKNFIKDIVTKYGGNITFVGHSLGGAVVNDIAQRPGDFGLSVGSKFIAFSSPYITKWSTNFGHDNDPIYKFKTAKDGSATDNVNYFGYFSDEHGSSMDKIGLQRRHSVQAVEDTLKKLLDIEVFSHVKSNSMINSFGFSDKKVVSDGVKYNSIDISKVSSSDGLLNIANDIAAPKETNRDFITGSKYDDVIFGLRGSDIILGVDGDDVLFGGASDDHLDGGKGRDELHGGSAVDNLYGGDDFDFLYGEAGNDILRGGEGWDFMDGGTGDDWFVFAPGDIGLKEWVLGGRAGTKEQDGIVGRGSLDFSKTSFASIEKLKFDAAGVFTFSASEFRTGRFELNEIIGSTGTDVGYVYLQKGGSIDFSAVKMTAWTALDQFWFIGSDGKETIRGSAGRDHINGNIGSDVIYGGGGNDDIVGDSFYWNSGAQSDNDRLYGQAGDDSLYGNHGSDYLDGGADKDWLDGGPGADILKGGTGKDTFQNGTFSHTFEVDHYVDFSHADGDLIRVDTNGSVPLYFNKSPSSASGEYIIYQRSSGKLFVHDNAIFGAGTYLIAILDNKASLTHSDFEFM